MRKPQTIRSVEMLSKHWALSGFKRARMILLAQFYNIAGRSTLIIIVTHNFHVITLI